LPAWTPPSSWFREVEAIGRSGYVRLAGRVGPASRAIGSVVERLVHTEEVTGSNPVSPTYDRDALFRHPFAVCAASSEGNVDAGTELSADLAGAMAGRVVAMPASGFG
jgi:hypothetical protein